MNTRPELQHAAPAASDPRLQALLDGAGAHLASGRDSAAATSFKAALEIDPGHVGALLGLAELHLRQERHNPARALVNRALSGRLDSPRLALQLMAVLGALSESGRIVEIARQLPPPMWDSAQSLAEIAHLLSAVGAHELARGFARAGVARDPAHPPSLFMHATLDVFFGDTESAAEHAERCIAILPGDPGSHWLLSRLRQPGAGLRIDRLERELERAPDPDAEAHLAYALHNELHEQRDFERAWDALERGCRARRGTLDYDPESSARLFEALRSWSPEEAQADDGHESDDLAPVFIIGLHRSGTTLAERILSGHSMVSAGGETYDIRAQLRRASGLHFARELDLRVLEERDTFDYRAIGEGYLQGVAWRSHGRPVLTDKLPSNYLNLGFIARALPRARFIHLRRDPVDVGLSSLRTLFSHACPYSYDQQEYVAHHRHYLALMAHWRALFPGRILDVDYPSLVQAPADTAGEMARFCGLAYEPAMLAIESRSEAVSTASSVMVRDGIRTDRARVWQAYERQLQPMIDALHAGA